MIRNDSLGHATSGANAESLALYEQANHELQRYVDDPLATVEAALVSSPALTMGHVLKAYLFLLGTEPAGRAPALAALAAAEALPATPREQAHLAAARQLAQGRFRAAGALLEDVAIDHPRDVLALQVGHQIDFFVGDSRMLRDRIARARPHWQSDMPGCHAVLGMHAFGLEETGDHAAAEQAGRQAIELEPRDGWAQHAVAHVMEMQRRRRDGIRWMTERAAAWSAGSFFAVHNWWHLALFHLDEGDADAALALYDGPMRGNEATLALELIDATAMLWRLQLRGVDVGDRWSSLADRWRPLVERSHYAFNDAHAMITFIAAARDADAGELLAVQQEAAGGHGDDDNTGFSAEVGLPLSQAIMAFGAERYEESARLLRAIRHRAHRFGGSHAQRDLIDLTLIAAAERGGIEALAGALRHERAAARPEWRLPQAERLAA